MKYDKALYHAYLIDPFNHKDLVHDAYIAWFEKTNGNLFDEEDNKVTAFIKKTWYKNYFGKTKPQKFLFTDSVCYDHITPEDEFIKNDPSEKFITMNSIMRMRIYKFILQGKSRKQIAFMINEPLSFVNYYFNRNGYPRTIFN